MKNKNLNKLVKSIRFRLNDVGLFKNEIDQLGNKTQVKCKVFSNAQILNAIEYALNCINSKVPRSKYMLDTFSFSVILHPILEHGAVSRLLYSQALIEAGREQNHNNNGYYIAHIDNMMLNQAREKKRTI